MAAVLDIQPRVKNNTSRYVKAGSALRVECQVYDNTVTPKALVTPGTAKDVEVYKPDGTVFLSSGAMSSSAVGVLNRTVTTSGTSPTGGYTAKFTMTHSGNTVILSDVMVFTLF